MTQRQMPPPATLESLKQVAMGDVAFLRDMVEMFLAQSAEQLAALEALCVAGTVDAWSDAAHALKGSAASVGAEDLRLSCARAQDMRTASRAARVEIYGEIAARYDVVRAYLRAIDVAAL